MQRQQDVRTARLLPFAIGVFALLAAACGQPAATGGPAATASRTVPAIATAVVATPAATSAGPGTGGVCHALGNSGTATEAAIEAQHGLITGCISTDPPVLVVQGAATGDPRPGMLVCAAALGASRPDCGAGLRVPVSQSRNQSYLADWRFYPFPAPGAKPIGTLVFPQRYQCVGTATQLWTFHLETLMYTSGCQVPPSFDGIDLRLCDAFLYSGAFTSPPLYATYGRAAACGLFGNTVVGVVDGKPQPGLVVCAAAPTAVATVASEYCGLYAGDPPVSGRWQFVPLPVASGPVTGATFDSAAGTACVRVGAQAFTFTVATRAVTPGCAAGTPAPVATATP